MRLLHVIAADGGWSPSAIVVTVLVLGLPAAFGIGGIVTQRRWAKGRRLAPFDIVSDPPAETGDSYTARGSLILGQLTVGTGRVTMTLTPDHVVFSKALIGGPFIAKRSDVHEVVLRQGRMSSQRLEFIDHAEQPSAVAFVSMADDLETALRTNGWPVRMDAVER